MHPSNLSSILRWGGAEKLPQAQQGWCWSSLLCHTGRWGSTRGAGVGQMDDAATSHLPAGSNTAQLTGNKLPRPPEILKEHSAASANQKAVLCWAVSPGRGLQVMSCSSPASHLSSSFSLSVSSSISSSWTLALMAVSSWGDESEVRLAQSQARVVQTPPHLYSLCQMAKNKIS